MGEVSHILRRIILTITLLILVYIYINKCLESSLDAYGTIYIVDDYVDTYYEPLTENTGYTTINGISNVFVNMKKAGYTVYNSEVTNNYIDAVFIKDDAPTYRYYFTYPEGKMTVLSSDYESSFLGVSYIIEE